MRAMTLVMVLLFCASSLLAQETTQAAPQQTEQEREHNACISKAILSAQAIRPGMQRSVLDASFTTEGGISSARSKVYVWRECPYIKIHVELAPVSPNDNGRVEENARDVITSVSQPYLQFSIMD